MKDPGTGWPELGMPTVAAPPASPVNVDRFKPDGIMSLKLLINALSMLEMLVPPPWAVTRVPDAGATIVAACRLFWAISTEFWAAASWAPVLEPALAPPDDGRLLTQ